MLVQDWMTTDVLSITPDTSMMRASRLMKDNKVRRLPVVDEQNRVVGIVSDRDIKEASPSKATTLDMHELYYLLSEVKIKDIMTKSPVCATGRDSVEGVALVMTERHFGGMPVVNDAGKLIGIITDSDIFKLLVSITGVQTGGMQLAFELPNRSGTLRPILNSLRDRDKGVISVLTSQDSDESPTRKVYIRLRPMPAEMEEKLVKEIQAEFPTLVSWEAGLRRE